MVRTLPLDSESRPDPSRILGIAAAIAVHAFAFMLLLIPMATPALRAIVDNNPDVIWIDPKPAVIEETVIEKTRQPVTPPQTITKQPEKTVTSVEPQVIVEGGSVASEATANADPGPTVAESGPTISGPVSVGNLAYVRATPPPYPRTEARAGVQGTVLLKVLVDVDGRPLEVVVLESSGNRMLDRSAREHVLKTWLFQPALRDGKAVQAYGKVPVVFSMQ